MLPDTQSGEGVRARCADCDKVYRVPRAGRVYTCKACGGSVSVPANPAEPGEVPPARDAPPREDVLAGKVTCSSCHAIHNGGERFCGECGAVLGAAPTTAPAPETVEARHEAMDALKRGSKWMAGIAWLYRLGALAYGVVTTIAVFALISPEVPLEAGILVVALSGALTLVMLVGALQLPFHPFAWTIVTAVLATGVSVAHFVGPNPLGLASLWSAMWAVLFWAALAPARHLERLIARHTDMYVMHHASRRTRRSVKGRSPRERHERLLAVMHRAARRAWKVSVVAVLAVVVASSIGTWAVATRLRPELFADAVADFEATWNASEVASVGAVFAPSSRAVESTRLIGLAEGHGWGETLPHLEGGVVRETKGETWVDYEAAGLPLSLRWTLDDREWRLIEFELPDPPVDPTLERFLAAWRSSDGPAIAALFPPEHQERMRASIERSFDRRGWTTLPPIEESERTTTDEGEVHVRFAVETGDVATKWVVRHDGRWGLYALSFPKAR